MSIIILKKNGFLFCPFSPFFFSFLNKANEWGRARTNGITSLKSHSIVLNSIQGVITIHATFCH